jgi:obg-like ATPase 1
MAPKKAQSTEPRLMLGRPSNNLKMGVVGLPNVGKSTFFNAITCSSAPAENFPFCTIDPEESRVAVPDTRLTWLFEHYRPKKEAIPSFLTVIDIAGLVKGASAGEGLGNAFLSHIKAVDGIFHVVRAFSDDEVTHVEGEVDPIRDLEIIHEELRLKDEEFLQKHFQGLEGALKRQGKNADKNKVFEMETAEKALKLVRDEKKDIRVINWTNKEIDVLNQFQLLTAKPVVYLVNLSEKDFVRKKNKWLAKIKAWVDKNSSFSEDQTDFYSNPPIIPFSCKMESFLASEEDADTKKKYLENLSKEFAEGAEVKSILPKIITTGYAALNLIYFFTAGEDEVKAWTIRKGTKAPQAAGVIHTDFERGFIMAEIMKFTDLKELAGEANVKAGGKYYQKGKDYIVEDGDVILFKFNVTNDKKK